jgi:branched-chain amino acid transport system ATP-binding protein
VDFGGVRAVDDVSVELQDGELLGFIGPNGAGKTTLMRVITGVVPDHSGIVYLSGEKLNGLSIETRVRRGIALSQQIVKPFHSMSMLENVMLAAGLKITRKPFAALRYRQRGQEKEVAMALLARLGIDRDADKKPDTLPLGIRKRLEVARALALSPKLLLLDEPLAGLNHEEAAVLAGQIQELHHQGQSILLIEHNLAEVARICPRLYVQDNGRALACGDTREVLANAAVQQAYTGMA